MNTIAEAMPFARMMGVAILDATRERVVGELVVREDLCTTGKILHGGAAMAFADTLGGVGAYLALPEGAKATTTIESKTNFLSAAPLGVTIRGECTPVHIGRSTSVWQTKITTAEGRPVAIVTQTQMTLMPR